LGKINFPRITVVSVTTTTTKVLEANPKRKAVLIFNNGDNPVELVDNKQGTYGQDIPIAAGSAYSSDHFNCQGEYWIICSAGTEDIRIEETIQGDS